MKDPASLHSTLSLVYKYCDTPNAFQKNPGYEVVPDMEAIMEEWGEKYHNHDFATDHITQAILDEWWKTYEVKEVNEYMRQLGF